MLPKIDYARHVISFAQASCAPTPSSSLRMGSLPEDTLCAYCGKRTVMRSHLLQLLDDVSDDEINQGHGPALTNAIDHVNGEARCEHGLRSCSVFRATPGERTPAQAFLKKLGLVPIFPCLRVCCSIPPGTIWRNEATSSRRIELQSLVALCNH